jgi:hypothetical protein
MTAEVAILNKSAVALAADSAVTISAGTKQEKIFDTADKLFELETSNNGLFFSAEAQRRSALRFERRSSLFCRPVGRRPGGLSGPRRYAAAYFVLSHTKRRML